MALFTSHAAAPVVVKYRICLIRRDVTGSSEDSFPSASLIRAALNEMERHARLRLVAD